MHRQGLRLRWAAGCLYWALTGLAPAGTAHADVRVWTDREQVILKGTLKGIEVLPQTGPQGLPKAGVPRGLPKAGSTRGLPPAPTYRGGRVLRVGKNRRYAKPSLAARNARDGDTIEIDAGSYIDCATWRANSLVIRGVGGRAHVRDSVCAGKAIWITQGNDITIERIEFSGMRANGGNGAGIRLEGVGLTVRDSAFHDGEEGILGGGRKPGDFVTIEASRFARIGAGGQAHGIYIGKVDVLTVRRSLFRDCRNEGHCVKSLARRTVISCNVIASLGGDSSYEIDIPFGGHAEIRNNVIQQGEQSANDAIVAFAASALDARSTYPEQTLIMQGNTVINDRKEGGRFVFVRPFAQTVTEVRGNVFVGPGKLAFADGNKLFADRAAAGLPAYPALPPMPDCPK